MAVREVPANLMEYRPNSGLFLIAKQQKARAREEAAREEARAISNFQEGGCLHTYKSFAGDLGVQSRGTTESFNS